MPDRTLTIDWYTNGGKVKITDRNQGFFEIKGVAHELIDSFSKRRDQVVAAVSELKRSGMYGNAREAQLYEIAALGSRKGKEEITQEGLMRQWTEALQSKGWTLDQIRQSVRLEAEKEHEATVAQEKRPEIDTLLLAARAVTEQEAIFHQEKVLETALKLSVGEKTVNQMQQAYQQLLNKKEIKALGEDRRGALFTTKQMQQIERRIATWAKENQGNLNSIRPDKVDRYLHDLKAQGAPLTRGQTEAIRLIASSKDAMTLIQGDAGTGKTAAMAAVRELMEREGWTVQGLAFTGKAASELTTGSGIQSQTVAGFLKERLSGPTGRQVWIVDEASMIGSKDLHQLIQKAEQAAAKIVLIGDRKQFQSIQAGRMFSVLQDRAEVKKIEMTEVLRQRTEHQKEVVRLVGSKEIDQAFLALEKRGALIEIADRPDRLKAVTETYLTMLRQGKDALVLTARNEDRNEINQQIRTARVINGEMEGGKPFQVLESLSRNPALALIADSYKPGQILITTGKIGPIKSGSRLEIVSIHRDQNTITAASIGKRGLGKRVEIDVAQQSDRLTVYERVEKAFSQGDRIVFLKNDRKLGIQNGLLGQIEKIDDQGRVQVQTKEGRLIHFHLNEGTPSQYNFLTHAYALTEYKAQGQTTDAVIWHTRAEERFKEINTMNSFYVAITRAREEAIVFTDSKEDLKEQVKQEQQKRSTLDYEKEREGEQAEVRSWDLVDSKDTKDHSNDRQRENEREIE